MRSILCAVVAASFTACTAGEVAGTGRNLEGDLEACAAQHSGEADQVRCAQALLAPHAGGAPAALEIDRAFRTSAEAASGIAARDWSEWLARLHATLPGMRQRIRAYDGMCACDFDRNGWSIGDGYLWTSTRLTCWTGQSGIAAFARDNPGPLPTDVRELGMYLDFLCGPVLDCDGDGRVSFVQDLTRKLIGSGFSQHVCTGPRVRAPNVPPNGGTPPDGTPPPIALPTVQPRTRIDLAQLWGLGASRLVISSHAVSGSNILVGAAIVGEFDPSSTDEGLLSGSALVLQRDAGGRWAVAQQIDEPTGSLSESFGSYVAMRDGMLAVGGARAPDGPAGEPPLAVALFARNASGAFAPIVRLPGEGPVALGLSSVAVSDKLNSRVYVYERRPAGWVRTASIADPEPLSEPQRATLLRRFPEHIALDSDLLVVSAFSTSRNATSAGNTNRTYAYVFRRNADGSWQQTAKTEPTVMSPLTFVTGDVGLGSGFIALQADPLAELYQLSPQGLLSGRINVPRISQAPSSLFFGLELRGTKLLTLTADYDAANPAQPAAGALQTLGIVYEPNAAGVWSPTKRLAMSLASDEALNADARASDCAAFDGSTAVVRIAKGSGGADGTTEQLAIFEGL